LEIAAFVVGGITLSALAAPEVIGAGADVVQTIGLKATVVCAGSSLCAGLFGLGGAAGTEAATSNTQRVVLSGHGEYVVGDGLVTIPEGTTVTTYSRIGGEITDALGNAIESNTVPSEAYSRVWQSGEKMLNHTLLKPDNLAIVGNPITVQQPTRLSEMLTPRADC
jgi:hypothetical protein